MNRQDKTFSVKQTKNNRSFQCIENSCHNQDRIGYLRCPELLGAVEG
jgi:hypothetical protein